MHTGENNVPDLYSTHSYLKIVFVAIFNQTHKSVEIRFVQVYIIILLFKCIDKFIKRAQFETKIILTGNIKNNNFIKKEFYMDPTPFL